MSGYDAIVVGAGFSGAVAAERLADRLDWRVLVLEQREHLGGNCHDRLDEYGVRVHSYGPHLFHTKRDRVWRYLNRFTDWRCYEHRVLAAVEGRLVSLPFNLTSLRQCFPPGRADRYEDKLIATYGFGADVPILELKQSPDDDLRDLAAFIYDRIFLNYTCKQWGCGPEEISPEVTARVPVRVSRDDRYFKDPHQGVPADGYTAMFQTMLDHDRIDLRLSTRFEDACAIDVERRRLCLDGEPFHGHLIYTGSLDALFGFDRGELPYRSLQFAFEHVAEAPYQPAATVNYPNDEAFTRITDFKQITGQDVAGTTIVREYPQAYDRLTAGRDIPYYPLLSDANQRRFDDYLARAREFENLTVLGRLGEYRYFNMDDAVDNALQAVDAIAAGHA